MRRFEPTFRRRTVLAGLAASAVPMPGFGQEKKVFRDLTQVELDRAYDQSQWAKNAQEVVKRYATDSAAVREKYKFAVHKYGPTEDETLDWFPPVRPAAGGARAPVHVFIHGGAWRILTSKEAAAPAPTFMESGAHYVALNFAKIPKVRLPDMADQVRRAIAWVHKNAAAQGGDPERIAISGHSSGGHLCGVALVTEWPRYGVPENAVKAGLSNSGMYDLEAVMLSARSSYVKISKEEEHALSAQRHLDKVRCPIVVAFGDGESPEFKRQSREFAAALTAGVKHASELFEAKGLNHFEVAETLNKPDGVLGRIALRQLGLAV